MKIFVTRVGGQLGHDMVNNAIKRGHEVIGSDIAEKYSDVQDGSSVVKYEKHKAHLLEIADYSFD